MTATKTGHHDRLKFEDPSRIVKVTNLPSRSQMPTLKETLYDEFLKYGKIISIRLDGDKKCAFIFFKHSNQAQTAVEAINEKPFNNLAVLKCEKIDFSSYLSLHSQNLSQQTLIHNLNQEQELDEYCSKATRTLYIGNLDRDVKHSDLREKLDKKYGDIIEIEIKKDLKKPSSACSSSVCSSSSSAAGNSSTGSSASAPYAFIQFSDIKSVIKAMRCMNGKCIGQNAIKLGFGKSKPTKTLWLDGIADQLKESHLKEFFRAHCESTVEQVLIDRNKCQALVYFSIVEDAKNCAERIRAKRFYDKKIMVDFASKEFISSRFEHLLDPKHHLFTNHNRLKPDGKGKRVRSPRSNSLNDSRSSSSSSSSSSSTSSSASTEATPNTTRSESVDSAPVKNEDEDKKRHYYDDQYPIDDLSHVLTSTSQKYKFYTPSSGRNQHSPSDLSHLLNDSPNHYRRYFNEPASYHNHHHHHHRHYYDDRLYRHKYYGYHVDKSSSSTSLNPGSYSKSNHKEKKSRKNREKLKSDKKKSSTILSSSKVSSSSSRSSIEEAKQKKLSQSRSMSSDSSSSISSVSNASLSRQKNVKIKTDRDDTNPQPMDVETPDESAAADKTRSQPNTPQVTNSTVKNNSVVCIPIEINSSVKDPRLMGTDSAATYLTSRQFNQEIEIPKFAIIKKNIKKLGQEKKEKLSEQTNNEQKTTSPTTTATATTTPTATATTTTTATAPSSIIATTTNTSTKTVSPSSVDLLDRRSLDERIKMLDQMMEQQEKSKQISNDLLSTTSSLSNKFTLSSSLSNTPVLKQPVKLSKLFDADEQRLNQSSNYLSQKLANSPYFSKSDNINLAPPGVGVYDHIKPLISQANKSPKLVLPVSNHITVAHVYQNSSPTPSTPTSFQKGDKLGFRIKGSSSMLNFGIDSPTVSAIASTSSTILSSPTVVSTPISPPPKLKEIKNEPVDCTKQKSIETKCSTSRPESDEDKKKLSKIKNEPESHETKQLVLKNEEPTRPETNESSKNQLNKVQTKLEPETKTKNESSFDLKHTDSKCESKPDSLVTQTKSTQPKIELNNENKIQTKNESGADISKNNAKSDKQTIKIDSSNESKILNKIEFNAESKHRSKPNDETKNSTKLESASESKIQSKSNIDVKIHSNKIKTDVKTETNTDAKTKSKIDTKNNTDTIKQSDKSKCTVLKSVVKKPEIKQINSVKTQSLKEKDSKELKSPAKVLSSDKIVNKNGEKLATTACNKSVVKPVQSVINAKKTVALVKKETKLETKNLPKNENKNSHKTTEVKIDEKKKELNKKQTDLNDLYDVEESDAEDNKTAKIKDKNDKKMLKHKIDDKKLLVKKNLNEVRAKTNKVLTNKKQKEDAKLSKCKSSSDSSSDSSSESDSSSDSSSSSSSGSGSSSGSSSSNSRSSESTETEHKSQSKVKRLQKEPKKKLSKKEKNFKEILKKKSHRGDSSDDDEPIKKIKKKKSSTGINRELAFLIENKDALAYSGSLYDRVKARPRQADTKKKKRKNKKNRKIIVQSEQNDSSESQSSDSESNEQSLSGSESDSKLKSVKNRIESSESDTEAKKNEIKRKRQKSTDSLFDSEETIDSKKEHNKMLSKPMQSSLVKRCRTDSTTSSASSTTKTLVQEMSAKKRKLPEDETSETNPCKTPKSSTSSKNVSRIESGKSVKANLESKMKKTISTMKQDVKNENKNKSEVKSDVKKDLVTDKTIPSNFKANKIRTEIKNEKIETKKSNFIKKDLVKTKKPSSFKNEPSKDVKLKNPDKVKTSLSSGSNSSIGHCVDEESLTLTTLIKDTADKNDQNLHQLCQTSQTVQVVDQLLPLEIINEEVNEEKHFLDNSEDKVQIDKSLPNDEDKMNVKCVQDEGEKSDYKETKCEEEIQIKNLDENLEQEIKLEETRGEEIMDVKSDENADEKIEQNDQVEQEEKVKDPSGDDNLDEQNVLNELKEKEDQMDATDADAKLSEQNDNVIVEEKDEAMDVKKCENVDDEQKDNKPAVVEKEKIQGLDENLDEQKDYKELQEKEEEKSNENLSGEKFQVEEKIEMELNELNETGLNQVEKEMNVDSNSKFVDDENLVSGQINQDLESNELWTKHINEKLERTRDVECSSPKQQFASSIGLKEETACCTNELEKTDEQAETDECAIEAKQIDLDSTQDYSSETIEMEQENESVNETGQENAVQDNAAEDNAAQDNTVQDNTVQENAAQVTSQDNDHNESKSQADLLKIEPSINLLKPNEPITELRTELKTEFKSEIETDLKQEKIETKTDIEDLEQKELNKLRTNMDSSLNQSNSMLLPTVSPSAIQFNPTQMDLNSAMSLTASLNNLTEIKLQHPETTNFQLNEQNCHKSTSNMDMLLEAIMVDQPKQNEIEKKTEKHHHHHHHHHHNNQNNHGHHHHNHNHGHHHHKHNKSDKQEKTEKQTNISSVEPKNLSVDSPVNLCNYMPPNFGSFMGSPSTPQKNSFAYSMPFILANTPKSKEEVQQPTTSQNPFSIQSHLKRSSSPALSQPNQFLQPTVPNLNSLDNWQAAYTKYPLTFLAPPPQYQQQQQQQQQQSQQQQANKTKQSPSPSPSPKVTTPKPIVTTPVSATETSIFPGLEYLDKMHLLLPPAHQSFNPLISAPINSRPANPQQVQKAPIQNMSVTSTTPKHSSVKPGKKQIAKEYEQQQQQQQQQQHLQLQQQQQTTASQILTPNTLPHFNQFSTTQTATNNPPYPNYYSPFGDLRLPFLFAAAAAHNQYPDLTNPQSISNQQQAQNSASQPNFKPNIDYMSQMMMSNFPNVYNDNRQSNQLGSFLSSQFGTQFGQNAYLNQDQKRDDSTLFTGYTEFQDRSNIIWYGSFTIKNDTASIGMNFVAGNMDIAKSCLGQMSLESNNTPLRILQRMRLEQSQLEGVQRKLQLENEHCILIAVPYGANMLEQIKQTNSLKNGFINYLLEKKAAGIVNVNVPNTSFVVHIFPPCDFTNDILRKRAPEMSKKLGDYTHLFIVIATV